MDPALKFHFCLPFSECSATLKEKTFLPCELILSLNSWFTVGRAMSSREANRNSQKCSPLRKRRQKIQCT